MTHSSLHESGLRDGRRDLVGYGTEPPSPRWPNGARLAVSVVVNYEEGAEMTHDEPHAPPETLSEWSGYAYPLGQLNLALESMYEYGARVGVWRVLNEIDAAGVPATIFAAAVALELNSSVATYLRDNPKHEVGCHGYRWEEVFRLSETEEREHLEAAVESIQRSVGRRPVGWYSRYGPSVRTRRLLIEEGGFEYDSDRYADDAPYTVPVDGHRWTVVPYSPDINDLKFWLPSGPFLADDFARYMSDSFDTLYEESESTRRVMSIGLHPRIVGRPGRISALREFLQYAAEKPDVWFATRSEIARAWKADTTQ